MINKLSILSILIISFAYSNNIDFSKIENNKNIDKNLQKSFAGTDKDSLSITNDSQIITLEDRINLKKKEEERKKKEAKKKKIEKPVIVYKYEDEIMYNFLLVQDAKNMGTFNKQKTSDSYYTLKNKNSNKVNNSQTNSKTSNNTTPRVWEGYCQTEVNINVYDENINRDLFCKDNAGELFTLNVTFVPNATNELLKGEANNIMLNGELIILSKENSQILNQDGSSEQLATYVNSQKIKQYLLMAGKEVSKSLANTSKETFKEYQDSKRNEQATTDSNGNVVKTTNSTSPDIGTNIGYGLVTGVLEAGSKIAENISDKLPYHFQTVAYTYMKVKLIENIEGKK